jgi:hypothetical protein
MQEKKPSQYNDWNMSYSGGSGYSISTVTLPDTGAAQPTLTGLDFNDITLTLPSSDTITLDSSYYTYTGTGTSGGGGSGTYITTGTVGITGGGGIWNTSDWNISNPADSSVRINSDGLDMNENCDIKIGDRSLKDFINSVEDRLAILRPNPDLEDRWEQLKDLRRQYEALEKDILEKEKIMKILKES